jgi:hypothetical protein
MIATGAITSINASNAGFDFAEPAALVKKDAHPARRPL